MRVAIVGAPGSGKAELMKALKESGDFERYSFLETPVHELQESGRAMGQGATYHEHILLHAAEQAQVDRVENPTRVIQSGTVLQRLAHLCVALQDVALDELDDRTRAIVAVRLQPTIEVFTSLVIDTFHADVTFMLVRPETGDLLDLNYEDSVQFQLGDVMDRLKIGYKRLGGDTTERAQFVLEAVNEHSTANT